VREGDRLRPFQLPRKETNVMRQPRILMCPPDHYGIEYEINPWMKRSCGSTPQRSHEQWHNLYETLRSLGAAIELIRPQPGLPDLVFTANAGLLFGRRFFSSRFRHPVRRRETPQFDAWFTARGYVVEKLPHGFYFEGAGDALFCGSQLFAGYRTRSEVRSHQYIARATETEVLPLELVDPRFYHLDTCFCPLAPGEALYYPGAFDRYGRLVLERYIPRLLAVGEAEAEAFACNAVVVGRTVITQCSSAKLAADLRAWNYEPVVVPMDEFLKAGGSAKCLTLRLDGEEAAPRPARTGALDPVESALAVS
jgi:N-dimethylarginine dimethylaminohydrolase